MGPAQLPHRAGRPTHAQDKPPPAAAQPRRRPGSPKRAPCPPAPRQTPPAPHPPRPGVVQPARHGPRGHDRPAALAGPPANLPPGAQLRSPEHASPPIGALAPQHMALEGPFLASLGRCGTVAYNPTPGGAPRGGGRAPSVLRICHRIPLGAPPSGSPSRMGGVGVTVSAASLAPPPAHGRQRPASFRAH